MKDLYRAGKCPECGEYAVDTQRHIGAPVFCKNRHSWQRPNIEELQETIKKLQGLIKDSFIEGHNVDYFKDIKGPVLSYWLKSQSHLELKRINDE